MIAQWGMAAVYLTIAVRAARSAGTTLRPGLAGVAGVAASGGWLVLRTLSLRIALVATIVAATDQGITQLATLQVAMTIFFTVAFMLDALAIAGQAMVGHGLGASDAERVRAITRRLVRFGVLGGLALGVVIAVLAPVTGTVFTTDAAIRTALVPVLLLLAAGVPLAGLVFVLDGVLIGAGDARYLALTGIANLAVYLPLLAVAGATDSAAAIWAAFGLGYLGARAVTLALRARGERWLVTGVRS